MASSSSSSSSSQRCLLSRPARSLEHNTGFFFLRFLFTIWGLSFSCCAHLVVNFCSVFEEVVERLYGHIFRRMHEQDLSSPALLNLPHSSAVWHAMAELRAARRRTPVSLPGKMFHPGAYCTFQLRARVKPWYDEIRAMRYSKLVLFIGRWYGSAFLESSASKRSLLRESKAVSRGEYCTRRHSHICTFASFVPSRRGRESHAHDTFSGDL